jgi:outer membrane protein assembly factor BamA
MPGVADRGTFVVVEPFVEFATMDRAIDDRSGLAYRISFSHYRDRELDRYSFASWQADLRHFLTFTKDTRVLALRAWVTSASPDSGNEVPFYLQPTLGGARTLRGYRTFRFRDRSALLLQAEYRWRINDFVSGALFYDTGAVARTLADLGRLERNYGIGLRAGGRMGSAFRVDFAFGGHEGSRLLIRFDDAF